MLLLLILALTWLAAILGCAALALVQAFRPAIPSGRTRAELVIWPAVGAVLLSSPLWIEAIFLEIQCRMSGLLIQEVQEPTVEGLFWRSHSVAPNEYSSGIRIGNDTLRQAFTLNALRALAEGRIGYIEVPYEPPWDPQRTLNQKLYVAPRAVAGSQCLHHEQLGTALGKLPAAYCVAWETAQGLHTRFELVGTLGEKSTGTSFAIKDRFTGRQIGRYSYVKTTQARETILAYFGVRSLQPLSCQRKMTDIRPAAMLVSLVFADAEGQTLDSERLEEYDRSPWRVKAPSTAQVAVPEGRDGIEYWISQGKVRRLTPSDLSLWRAATPGTAPESVLTVPAHVYLIEGPIKLPAGLAGGHAVTWILRAGQPIPPGPRGHSTFLEVGKGCVWGSFHCQ